MKSCVRCYVSGNVQGVWYRGTTQEKARELGVTGHARNLPDGRVEVVACGDDPAIDALQEWLWEGSPPARVSNVECESIPHQEIPDFTTA
jgi:acylphosphatase